MWCGNGGHAIEEANKIPIEDEIENQRAKLTASTPITPELFMQWKKKKIEERCWLGCTESRES